MNLVLRPARPGELLKDRTPRRKAQPRAKDDAHLDFIRSLPCLLTGTKPVDAAHIRFGSLPHGKPQTGLGLKPDDRWSLPLSHAKHMEQHAYPGGEFGWWKAIGIDPLVVAMRLWEVSGDIEAGERVLMQARSAAHGEKEKA